MVSTPDPLARVKALASKAVWPAGGVLIIMIVVGGPYRHQLAWGDVPTWILAITTLLAFLAAGFAAIVAYHLYEIEAGRDVTASQDRMDADEDRRLAHRPARG